MHKNNLFFVWTGEISCFLDKTNNSSLHLCVCFPGCLNFKETPPVPRKYISSEKAQSLDLCRFKFKLLQRNLWTSLSHSFELLNDLIAQKQHKNQNCVAEQPIYLKNEYYLLICMFSFMWHFNYKDIFRCK